jgi:Lrp/AsnC family transcriptional regulator, leucine-responsive regulatory protein
MNEDLPLDRIDRSILRILQAEGRVTNQALAPRVGLSPSACLARVRQLERAGVIQGYHARLDPFRVGVGLVLFAEVSLDANGPDDLARFEVAIAERPQIVEASHVSGEVDYLLKVVVQDMPEWTRLKDELTGAEVGIQRITTMVLMTKPKIFSGYPIADR